MKREALGEQQLEVLQYVTDHAPATVREVALQFGAPRGLARTTILTVMERLRQKGYLTRKRIAGAYHYSPSLAKPVLLRSLVHDFVQKTLGGSLSPFLSYLTERVEVSDAELEELKQIVANVDSRKKGDSS